jgi:hypothetical protein
MQEVSEKQILLKHPVELTGPAGHEKLNMVNAGWFEVITAVPGREKTKVSSQPG